MCYNDIYERGDEVIDNQKFVFLTEDDETLSGDEAALGAFRWFMSFAGLNRPELSIFYNNASVKTFTAADFFPFPSGKIKPDKAMAFILVGGLDESDVDRAVLSYEKGSKLLILQFPGLTKLPASAQHLMQRFKAAMPLPELEAANES